MTKEIAERQNFRVPTVYQLPLEALGVFDAAKLFLRRGRLAQAPRGKNESILVLPGYGTDDKYTHFLRKYLNSLDYRADTWGPGRNHGNVPFLLEAMNTIVSEKYAQEQKKFALIGWSLGGYLAREIARDNPDKISCVVTMGSPVIGGPKYTAFGKIFDTGELTVDELEREIDKRYEIPIECPVLAIYSKADNIVSWQACRDPYSPRVTHAEITSTHIGFMVSTEAFLQTADFLHAHAR